MQFKDQIDFIKQHMKRNKLRVATTILAATMGCAFLIVLASIGFGLQQTMTDQVLDNQMVTQIEVYGKQDSKEKISDGEIQSMRDIGHVEAVVKRSGPNAEAAAKIGNRSGYVSPTFVNMEEEQKAGLALADGEMPGSKEEVVVGYHFAEILLTDEERELQAEGETPGGFAGSVIGQTFELELTPYEAGAEPATWKFTVSGIKDEPAKDWVVDSSIFMDNSWGQAFMDELKLEESYSEILVYADDSKMSAALRKL